jgi:hypothetical protein
MLTDNSIRAVLPDFHKVTGVSPDRIYHRSTISMRIKEGSVTYLRGIQGGYTFRLHDDISDGVQIVHVEDVNNIVVVYHSIGMWIDPAF